MPCGCKGGSWTPPTPGAQAAPAAPTVVKGWRAPGWYAPSKSQQGAVAKKA